MHTPDHPDWPEWQWIIYHEAGHAALSIDLWNEPAPIIVLRTTDKAGNLRKGGRFKVQIGFQLPVPGLPPPENKPAVEQVMVCAAGGVTEVIKFDHESAGFLKDKYQIDSIVAMRGDDQARLERDNDYPRTRQKLSENDRAIEAIATQAMQSFIAQGLLGRDFTEAELLDGDSVAAIYQSATQSS